MSPPQTAIPEHDLVAPKSAFTPEQRTERARKAGLSSAAKLTPEQRSERARNASAAAHSLKAHVAALVRRWPDVTPEDREKLRALLGGK